MVLSKKVRWLIGRWKVMHHPWEEVYRLRQFLQIYVHDRFFTKTRKVPVKFKTDNAPSYDQDILKKNLPLNLEEYRKYKFYDLEVDLFDISEWRKDYKNEISSLIQHSSKINPQNYEEVGDIRFVHTLSRLSHLPILVAGSLAHDHASLLKLAGVHLKDWSNQNPFLKSVNWKSGLEVGIRSMNLIQTRILLSSFPEKDVKACNELIDYLIYQHYRYLIDHLSLHSSANNHLIAELCGIFFITSHYSFQGSKEWEIKAINWLWIELMEQTDENGFSKEQSSHYHAEVLNMYVNIVAVSKRRKLEIPAKCKARIMAMAQFLQNCLYSSGKVLSIGDSDDGQILFPYFDPQFSLYSSIIRDIAIAFNVWYSPPSTDAFEPDIRNYLLWANDCFSCSFQITKSNDFTEFYKHSGYVFFREKGSRLVFDVGPLGLGKLAAHGHSDQLHFTLDVKGKPLIIDPGTFQYHSIYDKWRRYFRGTSAHNTISLANLDQSVSGGRMIWLKHSNLNIDSFIENGKSVSCTGTHSGFIMQGINIKHTRKVSYLRDMDQYVVEDFLNHGDNGKIEGSHYLHFHPNIQVQVHSENEVRCIYKEQVLAYISCVQFQESVIYRGSENPISGWHSDSFNKKDECTTLKTPVKGKNQFNLRMTIKI